MKTCEECDLPTPICSALAMYRKSVQYYGLGRPDEAKSFAEFAEELYEDYRKAMRAAEATT